MGSESDDEMANADADSFLFPSTLELPNPHSPTSKPVEPQCNAFGDPASPVSEAPDRISVASANLKAMAAVRENMDKMRLQHSSDLQRSIKEFTGLQRHLSGQLQEHMQQEFQEAISALRWEIKDSQNVLYLEMRKLLTQNAETHQRKQSYSQSLGCTNNDPDVVPDEGASDVIVQVDEHPRFSADETKSGKWYAQAAKSGILESEIPTKEAEEAKDMWLDFQGIIDEVDHFSLYKSIIEEHIQNESKEESFMLRVFRFSGIAYPERPQNPFANILNTLSFHVLQNVLILANSVLMAFEAEGGIQVSLGKAQRHKQQWVHTLTMTFNFVFAIELLYRIFAERIWFFVCPDWSWNMCDVLIVVSSGIVDLAARGSKVNFTFIRTFRLLRAIRIVRMFRVLRLFRELRKMLISIEACLVSLAWAFIFLSLFVFVFSILFLQGLTQALDEAAETSNPDLPKIQRDVEHWFSTLAHAMLSLLAAVTGGADWMSVREPLVHAGPLYTGVFLAYALFVIVGVMNVLTGVFLDNAGEYTDKDLIVQSEYMKIYDFVGSMLDVFKELDVDHTGEIGWERFQICLHDKQLQAYLSHFGLEATHARLVFDLLADESNTISMSQFVLGILRLKGEAKAMDTRIIRREIGMLKPLIVKKFKELVPAARRTTQVSP